MTKHVLRSFTKLLSGGRSGWLAWLSELIRKYNRVSRHSVSKNVICAAIYTNFGAINSTSAAVRRRYVGL